MHIQKHLEKDHSLPDVCCDYFLALNEHEVLALLKELEHSHISYENPTVTVVVHRLMKFRDELDKRNSQAT